MFEKWDLYFMVNTSSPCDKNWVSDSVPMGPLVFYKYTCSGILQVFGILQ